MVIMNAKLITYTTERLNNSEKSILSKSMYGYKDKSNSSRYIYQRKGILDNVKYVKVCNNTFIVLSEDWPNIKKELEARKATIKEWDIIIDNF